MRWLSVSELGTSPGAPTNIRRFNPDPRNQISLVIDWDLPLEAPPDAEYEYELELDKRPDFDYERGTVIRCSEEEGCTEGQGSELANFNDEHLRFTIPFGREGRDLECDDSLIGVPDTAGPCIFYVRIRVRDTDPDTEGNQDGPWSQITAVSIGVTSGNPLEQELDFIPLPQSPMYWVTGLNRGEYYGFRIRAITARGRNDNGWAYTGGSTLLVPPTATPVGSVTPTVTPEFPYDLRPSNLRVQNGEVPASALLGWEFNNPEVVFQEFVLEEFVPSTGLADPWLPLTTVGKQVCEPRRLESFFPRPTDIPTPPIELRQSNPMDKDRLDANARGVVNDPLAPLASEEGRPTPRPENYYCVTITGLVEGVEYRWSVRIYYYDPDQRTYRLGPRAFFRPFTYFSNDQSTDPGPFNAPQNLRGWDISQELDNPDRDPEYWVLLTWEGHPAARSYHVERFLDEADYEDFIAVDEYEVLEEQGVYRGIQRPLSQTSAADTICRDVVIQDPYAIRAGRVLLTLTTDDPDNIPENFALAGQREASGTPRPPLIELHPMTAPAAVLDDLRTDAFIFNRPPVFLYGENDPDLSIAVDYSASFGTPLGNPIRAVDYDLGQQLFYNIIGHEAVLETFDINRRTGQISVRDFRPLELFNITPSNPREIPLEVLAYDQHGGLATQSIVITVHRREGATLAELPPGKDPDELFAPLGPGLDQLLYPTATPTRTPVVPFDEPDEFALRNIGGARLVRQCSVAIGAGELDGGTTYIFRVRGVDAMGEPGPYSDQVRVTTRGRAEDITPVPTVEGQILAHLRPAPQTIEEWGTSLHVLLFDRVLQGVTLHTKPDTRLYLHVVPVQDAGPGEDVSCPAALNVDDPTLDSDEAYMPVQRVEHADLYPVYPELEGDIVGAYVCLFAATLQKSGDEDQTVSISQTANMQIDPIITYDVRITPATGSRYFILAPIEKAYSPGSRYRLRLEFTDRARENWNYMFTFAGQFPTDPDTEVPKPPPVRIANLSGFLRAESPHHRNGLGMRIRDCDDLDDDAFDIQYPPLTSVSPTPTSILPAVGIGIEREQEFCLAFEEQDDIRLDTLHFYLNGIGGQLPLPEDSYDTMCPDAPVVGDPGVAPECFANFSRWTGDLNITGGIRGALVGRVPRCDKDDILCLRKVVAFMCGGLGMNCDSELFFNFLVLAAATGLASMPLFASWRIVGEITVLHATFAYMMLVIFMILSVILLDIPEYQAAIPVLMSTVGGFLVIYGRIKSRT